MRSDPKSESRVIAYRFTTTLRRRVGSYLAVALVIALLGGAAIASIAGARRTASSFNALLAATDTPNFVVLTGLFGPEPSGYDPHLVARLASLPGVERIESQGGYSSGEVGPGGRPMPSSFGGGFPQVGLYSSIGGLFYKLNRLIVLEGRLPDRRSRTQVAVTAEAARLLGVHVGSRFGLGVSSDRQSSGCQSCVPYFHTTVTVVGIVTSAPSLIVDDTDVAADVYASPAFTKPLLGCCVDPTISMLQLRGDARAMAATEAKVVQLLPKVLPMQTGSVAPAIANADRVLGPDALALYVFGTIIALLMLLLAGQALGRLVRRGAEDRRVLRALGASPLETGSECVPGALLAIVVGVAGAVGVAWGLSPLTLIGPVRAVEPSPGFSFDAAVVLVGAVVIGTSLLAVTVLTAIRLTPHGSSGDASSPRRPPAAIRAAIALGLPVSAVAGLHLALGRQRGVRRTSLRSAAVGASLAVTVLVATLTFGASLDQLVASPALYGWNWTAAITAADGVGVLPAKQLAEALDADHAVAAWSGVDFGELRLDGMQVPVLGVTPAAPVAPPLLSGHGVDAPDQIVLGTATLAALRTSVGGSIVVTAAGEPRRSLHVVGTATLPAIGGGAQHLEMGSGALLDYRLIPAIQRDEFQLPGGGPNVALVRLRAGSGTAGLARLRRLAHGLEPAAQDSLEVIPLLRPAVVANAGTLRSAPSAVAVVLAAGALLGLELALVALVRRTRRELALLRVLGFERRQLVGAVAWQASLVAAVGAVVGVLCGVALGRWLWTLFAQQVSAVPAPAVPLGAVGVIVLATFLLANALALLPGLIASRSHPMLVLRAE